MIDTDLDISDRQAHLLTAVLLVAASFGTYLVAAAGWSVVHPKSGTVVNLLLEWDSRWYIRTIESGYMTEPIAQGWDAGQANWAFFPLYPLAVAAVKLVTPLSTAQSGLLASNGFLIGAIYYSFRYVSETRTRQAALPIGILLAFGPYSFYFSTVYSESLFIFLIAASFYYLQQEKWLYCGVTGALLSATRAVGVLFAAVLVVRFVLEYHSRGLSIREMVVQLFSEEERILAVALVPLGIGLYMLFLYLHVGDALAFMHVQTAWDRAFGNPILTVVEGFLGNGWMGGINAVYLSFWAVAGILAGGLLVRRSYTEALFVLGAVVIPLSSSLWSMPRYVVGTLLFYVAVADVLDRLQQYKWIVLAMLASWNVPLLFLWFSGNLLVS